MDFRTEMTLSKSLREIQAKENKYAWIFDVNSQN